MKSIVMLLLGLAIGVLGAVSVLGAMRQEVPHSRAVMTLASKNFNLLRKMPEGGSCDAARMQSSLRTLAALPGEMGPAFLPTGGDDALFERHVEEFRRRAQSALERAPTDCATLAPLVKDVGGGCKACHDDFKP